MEPLGFEKSGKVTLVGFVIFSLIIIWVVNVYLNGEREYKQRALDMELSKSILLDSQLIDETYDAMYNSLFVQKEWLENRLTLENNEVFGLFSKTSYFEAENLLLLNTAQMSDEQPFGYLNIQGSKTDADAALISEINQLTAFFNIEKILHSTLDFEMNSIYFSKNQYVTYFPYVDLGAIEVDYSKIFQDVDQWIDTRDVEGSNFDVEKGWDQIGNDTTGNTVLTTVMPVVIEDEIKGILTGTLNEKVMSNLFGSRREDVYIVNKEDNIFYTNNEKITEISSAYEAFNTLYANKIKYYNNTFPTELEVRPEKDYTLYISSLNKAGWHFIYVVPQKTVQIAFRQIMLNLLMFLLLGGTVYYSRRFTHLKKDRLESIIKNSKYDGMTELLNHKSINDILKKIVRNKRVRRLSVMMMDIDDFKIINDTHGHAIGDDVIKICAEAMKVVLENSDNAAGRYGGEEFLVVAPRIDEKDAFILAERMRVSIHELIYEKMGLDVTISIGLYTIDKPSSESAEDLVKKADKNLYIAKNSGKNLVVQS